MLARVEYNSTEPDWYLINIGDYNEPLLNATKHFAQLAFVNLGAAQNAAIRGSMSDEAEQFATLYGGDKMALLETDDGWAKIRTGAGIVGYIASQLITTGFPYAAAEAFTLPNQVSVISEEAFAGIPLKAVQIPGSCDTIEAKAFDGTDLALIYLPSGVHSISEDSFPAGTIIFAPADSDAAEWAAENHRQLVICN